MWKEQQVSYQREFGFSGLTPPRSCPVPLLPAVADPGSTVLDREQAAVCYSTLVSGVGGNLKIGFETLSARVPDWRPLTGLI